MIDLALIDSILSNEFKVVNKELVEANEDMKVAFNTRVGCQFLSYKYDDLPAGYRGGFSHSFPIIYQV